MNNEFPKPPAEELKDKPVRSEANKAKTARAAIPIKPFENTLGMFHKNLFNPRCDSPLYRDLEFKSITSHYVTLNSHI